jgi:hypothetical protein
VDIRANDANDQHFLFTIFHNYTSM